MKELGLFVRWGRVFPGYEKEAVSFYDEVVRYFREKLHSGALTSFEPFLFMSGDHEESYGVFIMKEPECASAADPSVCRARSLTRIPSNGSGGSFRQL